MPNGGIESAEVGTLEGEIEVEKKVVEVDLKNTAIQILKIGIKFCKAPKTEKNARTCWKIKAPDQSESGRRSVRGMRRIRYETITKDDTHRKIKAKKPTQPIGW